MAILTATRFDALVQHFILPGAGQAIVATPARRKPEIGSTPVPALLAAKTNGADAMRLPAAFDAGRFGLEGGRRGNRIAPDEARREIGRILGIRDVPKDADELAELLQQKGNPRNALDIARRGRIIR